MALTLRLTLEDERKAHADFSVNLHNYIAKDYSYDDWKNTPPTFSEQALQQEVLLLSAHLFKQLELNGTK